MSNAENQPVPDINSRKPFSKSRSYLRAGWHPIPVPEGSKFPPEIGYTGRNGKYASDEDLDEWLERRGGSRQNVALRMGPIGGVSEEGSAVGSGAWETLGIDVDHYTDSDKKGGDTVRKWEKKLGSSLPPTWTSSARGDGKSGIRYYRVPAGLKWRGQVGPGVDVIQKAHRFAMVWPSMHPTEGQYRWYPPGFSPDGRSVVGAGGLGRLVRVRDRDERGGREALFRVEPWPVIPDPGSLPPLPDAWIDELTNGRTLDSGIDLEMDSTATEIEEWARREFKGRQFGDERSLDGVLDGGLDGGLDDVLCRRTRKALSRWKEAIDSDAGSHDKIRDGHFELLWLGLEGHSGWDGAVRALESYWSQDVGEREKRGLMEAGGEIWRSRINALRVIKAAVDSGERSAAVECACWKGNGLGAVGAEKEVWIEIDRGEEGVERRSLGKVRLTRNGGGLGTAGLSARGGGGAGPVVLGGGLGAVGAVKDPLGYTHNDEGNADHFSDLFSGEWRFVEGYDKWIYWNGKAWTWDTLGLMNRAFSVMYRQKMMAAEAEMSAALRMKAAEEPGATSAVKEASRDLAWAKQCGNFDKIKGCLNIFRSRLDVSVDSHGVDRRVDLLGVSNGVLELSLSPSPSSSPSPSDGIVFRQAEKEDMVVSNTNIPYVPLEDLAAGRVVPGCVVSRRGVEVDLSGSRGERAYKILDGYLDTFLPDLSVRAWVQQLLGYTLYGQNIEKKFIFLYGESGTGKSTLLEAVTEALGDYASSVEMEVFKWNKLNPALAAALPKRFITTTEAGGSREIPAESIKRMTGNDTLTVEMKNSNVMISRRPQFVPVIGTNNAPEIEGFDDAMKKRVEVVPFARVAPPVERVAGKDPGILLIEEAGVAVLSWLVEGWKLYSKHRLGNRPLSMKEVQMEFHDDMAPEISEFKTAMLREVEGAYVTPSDLFSAYQRWSNKTGMRERDVWSKTMLGKKMGAAGYRSKPRSIDGETIRVYSGLELRHKLRGVENIRKKDE